MKTLDRYIVRSFVFSAVLWFVIFLSLRVVVDMFVNLDEFTEKKLPFSETLTHISSYYGHQSLVYFADLGGIIIVLSAATTLVLMNRTNELTAMLASGVSLHRVVWPIVLCAMLMGGMVILDQELIIPPVAGNLVRSREDVPGTERFPVRLLTDGTQAAWYSQKFTPANQIMTMPLICLRNEEFKTLGFIKGSDARPGNNNGRPGWVVSGGFLVRYAAWKDTPNAEKVYSTVPLQNVVEKVLAVAEKKFGEPIRDDETLRANDITISDDVYGLRIQAETLVIEPAGPDGSREGELIRPVFTFEVRDQVEADGEQKKRVRVLGEFLGSSARWIPADDEESGHWALEDGVLFYPSDLTIEDLVLRRSSRWMNYMSTSQLSRLLKLQRVPDRKTAMLIRHTRFTEPINNLIMLLLGVPFVLSRERKIWASMALCVLMVGGFFAFIHICRFMDLPPTLSAWLPILLFGPVAVVMVDAIKT
jgi:hypothetical protein